ncbi:condensation domain-containing protein [Nocardia sp. NPDC057030]|uniref:condensation domain-containing protein n=1 Tax=unclassified Nocardia TaxID=2637762 RepID=UPI003630B416
MTEFAITRTDALDAVQRIMTEVLGVDSANPAESFHQLGGDSLRALKVAGRIAFEFRTSAAVDGTVLEALLDGVTGESLAQILLHSIEREAAEDGEDAPSRELSFGEERLWMAQQYQRDRSTYHGVSGFRVTGTLDLAALDRAVTSLVERHPALRTRYSAEQPAVHPDSAGWPSVDIVHEREVVPWEQAWARAERGIQEPFDLTSGRLMRVRTYRTGEREWLLQLVIHHIAIDGWSMDIIFRELATLYAGNDPGRGELAGYRDFARWQRGPAGLAAEAQAWAERLLPLPDRIDLGDGRRRTPTRSLEGEVLYTELPREVVDKLTRLAARTRTSLFVVLLALLHVCLARRTRQWDALIGTVVAGRSRPQDHETVGYFTNTLPVRASTSPDAAVTELITSLRDEWRYVLTHQGVSLEELAVRTRRAPDPARTPLVDVVLVVQNSDDVPLMLADCAAEPVWMHTGTAKFDLLVDAIQVAGELLLSWEYATEVLDAGEMAEVASSFEQLARAVPEDGAMTVRDLLRPTPAEVGRINALNATAHPVPSDTDVCGLFASILARHPDHIALYESVTEVTYRDLGYLRDQVVSCLVESGVGPGDVVVVDVPRAPLSVAAMLAIWSVGAIPAPVEPSRSAEQRALLVSACRPRVLVGEPGADGAGLVVISAAAVAAAPPHPGVSVPRRPEDPAWLVATPGATGEAEVVAGTHRGLLNRCAWAWAAFPYGTAEVAVVRASLGPVDVLFETLTPLLAGVPFAMLPDTSDPRMLADWMRRYRGTRVLLTPSLMWTMLRSVPDLSEALATLRVCAFSGEPLDADLLVRVRQALPECRLVNLYGCAEVAGVATWAEVTTHPVGTNVPIGRPIGNAEVFVVDEQGELCPPGVVGELVVAGAPVGLGYLAGGNVVRSGGFRTGAPAADGVGCFRTRDRGWLDATGQLVVAGRRVTVRGCRVDLSDVEAVLRSVDGVSGAVAGMAPTPAGDRVLAAVVPHRHQRLSGDDVRLKVQYRVPSYLVPARVVVVDALPLTARGTLDRAALIALAAAQDGESAGRTEVSPIEQRLQKIWSEVLHEELAGPDDNFFALGGDSLAANAMLTAVLREFGTELGLGRFLMQPTIRGIVDQLADNGAAVGAGHGDRT